MGFEGRRKKTDPEIVGIGDKLVTFGFSFVFGQAVGVKMGLVLYGFGLYFLHVEGRVGQYVVVGILKIVLGFKGVGGADKRPQAVDFGVHFGQTGGFAAFFVAIHREFVELSGGIFAEVVGTLDKHPARAAGGVEEFAARRLYHFHHEPHHGGRRIKLAAFLAFAEGKFAQKKLVDLAKHVGFGTERNGRKFFEEFVDVVAGEFFVLIDGQRIGHIVEGFHASHGFLEGFPGGFALGLKLTVFQIVVAGMRRQVKTTARNRYFFDGYFVAFAFFGFKKGLNFGGVSGVEGFDVA